MSDGFYLTILIQIMNSTVCLTLKYIIVKDDTIKPEGLFPLWSLIILHGFLTPGLFVLCPGCLSALTLKF